MQSAIYSGWVRHRRHEPVRNAFRYGLYMLFIDLAELPELFRGRLLWSARRPNLVWFRRRDYLGDPRRPLDVAVRDLVAARTGHRPSGPVRMLTHLRTFGSGFNPVTFYYCYDAAGEHVETIVAEITNTPWKERHSYVLRAAGPARAHRFRFAKSFHVSPFMPMDMDYDWRFGEPGERLGVVMEVRRGGRRVLDATLALERRPITGPRLAWALLRHPAVTWKVVVAIHLQALRLWWKRCPFHPHPARWRRAGGR